MTYPQKNLPAEAQSSPAVRTHARGACRVWVRMAGHWPSVFASDNRDEAVAYAKNQIRHDGNSAVTRVRSAEP